MDVLEQRRSNSRTRLETILTLSSIALGLIHAWSGRYSMNLDGVSYLDVGDSFARRDWANALNAWWSPLYPWTLGIALKVVAPSPKWEFPLVHVVNFVIFLAALGAFRFFLHRLLRWCHETRPSEPEVSALPDWSLILLGYAIFLWTSLDVVSIYGVAPDLAVLGCVCMIGGALLGLDENPNVPRSVLFGLVLGAGYWIKTILFPLGLIALICAYVWRGTSPSSNWRRGVAISALVFLCTTAPLVLLLSKQKGRFTIGETGRLNYARFVFPQMPWTNWQGGIPGGGIPTHPTRQILTEPPVFEFDGPVTGTYPPWTDPSYWNDGVQPHFRLRPQLEILATTVPSEIRVLFREQPALVAGVIVLVLLSGLPWSAALSKLWPLLAIGVIGMAVYLPLVVNDRYLAGYVLVLFLIILAAVRLRPADYRVAGYIAIAVFATMALGTIDLAVRYGSHHLVNAGAGPNSTIEDVSAAEELAKWGVRPGDKVAVIGGGTGTYWARLAKLRIVAEVSEGGLTDSFWQLSPQARQRVYGALASTRASLVMARCPARSVDGWEPIAGTGDCVYWLPERR